ncbi:MAG TPA: HAD-IA family hydrolase [Flavobacteriales bacterium]|nr:HAD-IA family hydrolase [Flavobacteriales bacterium]HRE96044.1 HAD-IA family hydrolase [Flavobacteriales bacterium]HRJ39612.1 HAD-IA family hydrolase [Flavobacteriales bacterium]
MNGIKVIVFDLDDTLYPEITYVHSGFKAVAKFLAEEYRLSSSKIYKEFILVLEKEGRGKVFDVVLKSNAIYSKTLVRKCLSVYRNHYPEIHLFPGVKKMLKSLKSYRLFIVTDGNKHVQAKKIDALGLNGYVEHAYITYRYGTKNMKPSVYCFELIAKRTNTFFPEMVYVGDNPKKDFVNIRKAGMNTVRVLQGEYACLKAPSDYDAEYTLNTINEIVDLLK